MKIIHHYITHYASNGKDYAEAWIQVNIFGKCFCLSKKRTTIERLYADGISECIETLRNISEKATNGDQSHSK